MKKDKLKLKSIGAEERPNQVGHNSFHVIPVVVGVTAVYISVLLITHELINRVQPIPYLDEIYHVPQAQEYCRGNFSHWDDRITTLPGLYLISISVLIPLSKLSGVNYCETQHLRFTNVTLSLSSFFLYLLIIKKLTQHIKDYSAWKTIFSALNVAIFPPMFFFAFLYYTDVAAAFLVFLMYGFHIYGRNKLAAFTGIPSMLARQTSVVWIIFVAISCCDTAIQHLLLSSKERKSHILSGLQQLKVILNKFFQLEPLSRKTGVLLQLFCKLLPFITVGLIFIVFVIINDGLVVGDRSAHQATINIPQLFYFFALVTLFAAPHCLPLLIPFCKTCLRHWILVLTAVALISIVIRYNTLVHPYLLADNRHYTFYVWKRVFEYRHYGRYIPIPFYLFGAYVTFRTLSTSKSFIFASAFICCCFVALVPQRLLEIRYFFIPFLFVRLHIVPQSLILLILEFVMYGALNVATFYMFVNYPFYWADSESIQRFMW